MKYLLISMVGMLYLLNACDSVNTTETSSTTNTSIANTSMEDHKGQGESTEVDADDQSQSATSSLSEKEQITKTLMDYIEGTANGNAERVRRAFHKDLNLYTVENDRLQTRSGQKYISIFEDGKKRNRIGSIVSIDYENDAASAKIKVVMPAMKRVYTDYLLLLKIEGHWKIIHKTYTYQAAAG